MKEALLWKKEGDKVRCLACSHKCLISEGKSGICRVRRNEEGKLVSLVYRLPVSLNVDPIEKKPLYHFFPGTKSLSFGTVGCNFKCKFCQNYEISQSRTVFGYKVDPDEIVSMAIEEGCKSISYTYNEPVVFVEFARDVAKIAKKKGIKNVFVSNGFESEETIEFLSGYIDAVNIDLKAFSDKFYRNICGGKLDPVLKNIKRFYKLGVWLEISTLVIPGFNDNEDEIRKIAEFIASISKDIPWHVIRFFPMYLMQDVEPTPIETLLRAAEIGKEEGLRYVYLGNVSSEMSVKCPNCDKVVVMREFLNKSKVLLKKGKCPFCRFTISGRW